MNGIILLDNKMAENAKNFESHYNIIDLDLTKVNKNLFIPPTTVATLTSYLHHNEKEDKNCPIYKQLVNS